MAKRLISESNGNEVVEIEPSEDTQIVYELGLSDFTSTTVKLRLNLPLQLNIKGDVSGDMYHFAGAGDEQPVSLVDVPGFLARYSGKSCCGGNSSLPYFTEV